MTLTNKDRESLLELAQSHLRQISLDRLRVAIDFLAYLEEREENEATQELLDLPEFEQMFREAVKQVEVGEVVRFRDIRRDIDV